MAAAVSVLLAGIAAASGIPVDEDRVAEGRAPVMYESDPATIEHLHDDGALGDAEASVPSGVAQIQMNRVQQIAVGSQIIVAKPAGVDADHDGRREFVVEKYGAFNGTFYFFESVADDTFELAHTLVASEDDTVLTNLPRDVGDADGDGLAEVPSSLKGSGSYVQLWESDSPSAFPESVVWFVATGGLARRVTIADTDRDGVQELVIAGQVGDREHRISFYENVGDNAYALTSSTTFYELISDQEMAVMDDLDGDGRTEIVYGGLSTDGKSKAFMVENVADNTYATVWTFVPTYQGQALNLPDMVDCGDLDGDGKKEFMIGGLKPGSPFSLVLLLYEAVGDNQYEVVHAFTQPYGSSSAGDGATVADVDGDGRKEVVIGSGKTMRIFRNTGDNAWEEIWSKTLAANLQVFGTGDHDGDGKEELLVFYETSGDVWEIDPDDAADPDADGRVTAIDNCPETANPGQEDADGDDFGDACDCAPTDSTVFAAPIEVTGLRFTDRTTLGWESQSAQVGSGTAYDVVRGGFATLPVGDPSEICLEPGSTDTVSEDSEAPAAGTGFFYLVRGSNVCAVGTYGTDSSQNERASAACR